MTSYGLDEWFWTMFELTWTWPNFTFGQHFMLIVANSDTSSVGPSNKNHPFCQMKVLLECRWLKDICLLQWQIVWDISQWFYKHKIELFEWPCKTWNTVHCSLYYMYYVDNFTTVCLNKMLLLWNPYFAKVIIASVSPGCSDLMSKTDGYGIMMIIL